MLTTLHRQLHAAILDGRLQPGLQLPATRVLARLAGVSRNTVLAAYELLQAEDFIYTRHGAGTFVSDSIFQKKSARKISTQRQPTENLQAKLQAPWRDASLPSAQPRPKRFDFRPGYPDQRLFPFAVWRRLTARALRDSAKSTVTFGDPQGDARLRASIAQYVSATRAVACTADNIIVTAGAQQAFDLLARVFVTPGRTRVAIENPGYIPLRVAFAGAGAKLISVPLDSEGFMVTRCPAQVDVIAVAPSHHFPIGMTMSHARRIELLDYARRCNAVVIEDDYDGEFRLSGRPIDALQTLDHDARVFYVGTFSKSMFPALRVGYIVVPQWARAALIAAKQMSNWHVAAATQQMLANFISEGHLARHVRRMRKQYQLRHTHLQDVLTATLGDQLRIQPSLAGLHFSATMTRNRSAAKWADAAAQHGVRIEPLSYYCTTPSQHNGLIFGYGLLQTNTIEAAVQALARAIK